MSTYKIAVLGGTGPQGKGLAYRFAKAGHEVVIGSRSAERAEATGTEIAQRAGITVGGDGNGAAARFADVVVLAVPWDGHEQLVSDVHDDLAGKVVLSCVNPLGFDKRGPYGLDVADGSAAEQVQRIVPSARVAGAFHHLSAVSLWGNDSVLDHEDVLVVGDDQEAKVVAIELSRSITGRDGIDAGALRLARQLEPLTAVLISINKRHKVRSGIRISGLDD